VSGDRRGRTTPFARLVLSVAFERGTGPPGGAAANRPRASWPKKSLSGQSTGLLEPGGYEPHLCEASRIFASYSFATEYPVERYFRDARFLLWGGGTSEILRVIIGRDLDRPPSLG
jgi:hypothetical protein